WVLPALRDPNCQVPARQVPANPMMTARRKKILMIIVKQCYYCAVAVVVLAVPVNLGQD
ncbi:Hypothetical predicted protein, partial [Paramuricea clavata]